MKEKQAIRGILLLSLLLLLARAEGIIYRKHLQRNIPSLPWRQMNGDDVYDCIDVNLQPSFDHPRLKDHKIQMQPSSFPVGLDIEHAFPDSVLEVQPSFINCPVGTVPILRNNRTGTIEAHNIDGVSSMDIQREVAGVKYNDDVYGAHATLNIWEPKVNNGSKDLSATWLQINNGGGEHTDRIGVGLEVYPSLSGDSFVRIHIGWTEGLYKTSCIDNSCPGFVQVSQNFGLGARLENVSVYDGPQYGIRVRIFKDPTTKNWWVTYGKSNTTLGYWPSALFTFLNDKGKFVFWGGFVQGPTASSNGPQMGSGHFASEGFGKAAFIRNMQIVDENNQDVTPEDNFKVESGTSNSTLYTVDNFQVDKSTGMSIFYGGPGSVV